MLYFSYCCPGYTRQLSNGSTYQAGFVRATRPARRRQQAKPTP